MKTKKYRILLSLVITLTQFFASAGIFAFDLTAVKSDDKVAQSRLFSIDEKKNLVLYQGLSLLSPIEQNNSDTLMVARIVRSTTSAKEVNRYEPEDFLLKQNYPNPFNPTTNIHYQIAVPSDVSLVVFDITGKEVVKLVNEQQSKGQYTKQWNASNVASGVYFYRLIAKGENGKMYVENKKMVLAK